MKRMIIVALAPMLLTGCAGLGFNDYEQYASAHVEHGRSEASRITAQSATIANALSAAHPKTDVESALMTVFAMQAIGQLQPTQLNIVKPTTGFDVLDNLAGQATAMVGFGALGYLGAKAIEGTGQVSFNGDSNTFAPFESHITGSSEAAVNIPYLSPTTTTGVVE